MLSVSKDLVLNLNADEINGHNSLIFREDKLINDNDEAFHGMMTGGGCTWFAVIKPYGQRGPGKINSRYPNAFFGQGNPSWKRESMPDSGVLSIPMDGSIWVPAMD
jgi:hypothetical protein